MMFTICLVRQNRTFHGGKTTRAVYRQKNFKQRVIKNAQVLFALSDREAEDLANKEGLTLEQKESFQTCLNILKNKYDKKSRLFYQNANISERMFQYIKNNKNPTKETTLAVAVSMNLNSEDTQRLLKSAGYILSKSIPSDAVILWMLSNYEGNQNTSLLFRINEVLYALDMPLLMTREKSDRRMDHWIRTYGRSKGS